MAKRITHKRLLREKLIERGIFSQEKENKNFIRINKSYFIVSELVKSLALDKPIVYYWKQKDMSQTLWITIQWISERMKKGKVIWLDTGYYHKDELLKYLINLI